MHGHTFSTHWKREIPFSQKCFHFLEEFRLTLLNRIYRNFKIRYKHLNITKVPEKDFSHPLSIAALCPLPRQPRYQAHEHPSRSNIEGSACVRGDSPRAGGVCRIMRQPEGIGIHQGSQEMTVSKFQDHGRKQTCYNLLLNDPGSTDGEQTALSKRRTSLELLQKVSCRDGRGRGLSSQSLHFCNILDFQEK